MKFPSDSLVIPRQCRERVVVRNIPMLINKAACKKFIMDYAGTSRHHKFSRLDPEIFDELNGLLRKHMRAIVARNPSFGKTIR